MKILKTLIIIVFSLMPILASAQQGIFQSIGAQIGSTTITPSFTPVITDQSISYLGQIFGTVGTILHGTSGQMLGQLFKVFNIGLLVLAGAFLVYTIFMTVLNTAHEGEFMGRKWNSAWIAVRTVLGLGLLVPSATTGYSTIQVIVMWVVIQGVGFANMAWDSALEYLAEGGQVYTPPQNTSTSMINLVGTIMEMQVCMYANQNAWQQQQSNLQSQGQTTTSSGSSYSAAPTTPGTTYVQNWTPNFTDLQDSNSNWRSVVQFPGNPYTQDGQQDSACGQISFGTNTSQSALDNDQKTQTLKAAVQQIVLDMDSYSKQIASTYQSNSSTSNNNNQNFSTQVQSQIVGAAADWVNITLPITSGANMSTVMQGLISTFVSGAAADGWIMAGKYYYALGSIQQQATQQTSVTVNIDYYPAGFSPNWSANAGTPGTNNYLDFSQGANVNPPPSTSPQNMAGVSLSPADQTTLVNLEGDVFNYVSPAYSVAKQVDGTASGIGITSSDAGVLNILMSPVSAAANSTLDAFSTATGDPILVLQSIGNTLLNSALGVWLTGTIAVFGLGTVSSVMASVQPLGYGVEDAILAFIPVFTVYVLTMATIGGVFAYYVPLIPFIIFVFSGVGWMIAVIEAMVAAPLVALGVTHPEGHDLLGKSEQAVMLLLSVFLRPVLMVIGLVAGMILSRVILQFLNNGFFGIVYELKDFSLFAYLCILMIYASLLVTIINQSFSLIYLVPDRVMRWLGVSEQSTNAQEALQSAKQGYEQVAGATEKLGSGVTQAGSNVQEKSLARRREKKQKESISGAGEK